MTSFNQPSFGTASSISASSDNGSTSRRRWVAVLVMLVVLVGAGFAYRAIHHGNELTKQRRANCMAQSSTYRYERLMLHDDSIKDAKAIQTGFVEYCLGSDGTMKQLWNPRVDPNGHDGFSEAARSFAKECVATHFGVSYDTHWLDGKNRHDVLVCVSEGRIIDYQLGR